MVSNVWKWEGLAERKSLFNSFNHSFLTHYWTNENQDPVTRNLAQEFVRVVLNLYYSNNTFDKKIKWPVSLKLG